MMNRTEEIESLLADVLPRLEALGRDARAELDAAREEARKVQKLIREGTKPELVRREVLGAGA